MSNASLYHMFPFLLSFLPLTFLLFCKSFKTSEALWKKACWVSISGGCQEDRQYAAVHPAPFSYEALWLQHFCKDGHCQPFSFWDGKYQLLTGKATWKCVLNPLGELHMVRGKDTFDRSILIFFSVARGNDRKGMMRGQDKKPGWDLPFSQCMVVCGAQARGPW